MNPTPVKPCLVCGKPSNPFYIHRTALCDDCYSVSSRVNGFLVINSSSQGFCYFKTLEPAVEFYEDGTKRGAPYLLCGVMKGQL